MTNRKIAITKFIEKGCCGSKRTNIRSSKWIEDWFVGYGKDESCQFEGTWWDMICFARNVLANRNTMLVAPEYYKPEWENHNYAGEESPYVFKEMNNNAEETV